MRSAALAMLVLAGCVTTPPPSPATLSEGTFVDGEGRPLSTEALRRRLSEAGVVVVGERHDAPCDHAVQARLVALLGAEGGWAVGLESVDVAYQGVLDRLNAGEVALASLEEQLAWPSTWGLPFALTAPLFEAAVETRTPVFALNAPRPLATKVGREGLDAVPPVLAPSITPEIVPPMPAQLDMLREAFGAHAHGAADPAAFDRFVRVQSFWDSQMAFRAAEIRKRLGRRVLVIAGDGHVRRGWGIPHRLAHFAPEERVVTIGPWDPATPLDPAEAEIRFVCRRVEREG